MIKKARARASQVIEVSAYEAVLKRKIRRHFRRRYGAQSSEETGAKATYRAAHQTQREERLHKNHALITKRLPDLVDRIADGREVDPRAVQPRLVPVLAGTLEAELFRLAGLSWSIPVSEGFGRRLKFLVVDEQNDKLIGLIALGDPVFNLGARDRTIGWGVREREQRLANVLDAYVLGSLPPYNLLLGGKLVACLIKTKDVARAFAEKYGNTRGVISNANKSPRLVMVTTTSAMGRSSVYNRMRIGEEKFFESVGFTQGYGHFHVPDALFQDLRTYLLRKNDPYANGNRFGQGPNWKLRVVRKSMDELGLGGGLIQHGFRREAFICSLASNACSFLRGDSKRPNFSGLRDLQTVSKLCVERWVIPRASRRPEFRDWRPHHIRRLINSESADHSGGASGRVRGNSN